MRIALITGGSRGIGRATVLRLLHDGWGVAFTYRASAADAKALEVEARGFTGRDEVVCGIEADVRNRARSEEVVREVLDRFGSIDGLVNNAGIRSDSLAANMTDEQWREVLETNLTGAFAMSQAVVSPMMKQRRGSIVNVASLSGLHGVVGQTNYAAAKGGLIAMTRSLAREVARSGIRVNCVAPGLVETDMIGGLDPDVRREMVRAIPMRRIIDPKEVAAAISFLLSDESSGITGQVLCVDGGTSA